LTRARPRAEGLESAVSQEFASLLVIRAIADIHYDESPAQIQAVLSSRL
jgi:hypothetical protein